MRLNSFESIETKIDVENQRLFNVTRARVYAAAATDVFIGLQTGTSSQ